MRLADEAICLGPATFLDPTSKVRRSAYLDEEHVLDVLVAARADAVWVGWGFVAEHASFAELCEKAGIVFVGPDSGTIRMLGDKIAAKQLAERVGVPVVEWSGGAVENEADAAAHAERLGFPVILKAAAGGGGRGIRVVRTAEELPAMLAAAQAEAAFSLRRSGGLPGALRAGARGTSKPRSSRTATVGPGPWASGTARFSGATRR